MRSKLWPIHNRPGIDMMHISCEPKVVADQDIDHLPNALSHCFLSIFLCTHTARSGGATVISTVRERFPGSDLV